MNKLVGAVAVLLVLAAANLAGCGTTQALSTSNRTSTVQTVTVTLTDTGVTASQTTFRPGERCHFIVTNRGTRPHQFWLMPQGMVQRMSEMPMAQWHQQVMFSTADIGPGMMATVDYTFANAMMHQQLAFGCYTANGEVLRDMPIHMEQ
jgi:uncharacterized cupredoxin-like copper-binding protein